MIILRELIKVVSRFISSAEAFSAMKKLVSDIESSTLTGAEKRTKVIADFEDLGFKLAGFVVDTLLQLALLYVRGI